MSKYASGIYNPKNPRKYAGRKNPIYRSSWELSMFITLDESDRVTSWASEPVAIKYRHPITAKVCNYYPDLLIQYVDGKNRQHVELIEIKPLRETMEESAKSKKDKIQLAINQSKWASAEIFCKQHGIKFRKLTEKELFFRKPKKGK